MDILAIVFGCISGVMFLMAAFFFCLYLIFERKPDKLGVAKGTVKKLKHKKNVPVYGRRGYSGPIRLLFRIKDLSKGVYHYTVDGKDYKIRYTDYVKAREMPLVAEVVYLKKIPRIAYVKTLTGGNNFGIHAFAALMIGVVWALGALSAAFGF